MLVYQYQFGLEGSRNEKIVLRGANDPYIRFMEGTTEKGYLQWNSAGYMRLVNQADGITVDWGDGYDQEALLVQRCKAVLDGSANPFRWRESSTDKAYIQWNASGGFLDIVNSDNATTKFVRVGNAPRTSFALSVIGGYMDMGGNWIYQGVGAGIYSPSGHQFLKHKRERMPVTFYAVQTASMLRWSFKAPHLQTLSVE